jgi:hypothetical protein
MGKFFGPYRLSMAQFSVRGACGFVLVNQPELQKFLCPWDFDASSTAGGKYDPTERNSNLAVACAPSIHRAQEQFGSMTTPLCV